jgi:hypothetical protein
MSVVTWFTTHKKGIITHTAVVAGFALFLVFASVPLFDKLEAAPGEARAHRLRLPAETTNMRYEIGDIRTDGRTGIEILGWAFVDGQDCQKGKIYVVLKSEQRTYVFDTRFDWKPDLINIDPKLVSNADYSGFKTLIPARKIDSGEYIVGLYIKYGSSEALQYTDRLVVKSPDSVNWAYRAAEPVGVTLPEESGNITLSITGVGKPMDPQQLFVEIRGWAFIEGQSTRDSRTYVVLKSSTMTYVFDTIPYFAWGIAQPYSAFIARIPMKQLEDGRYRIGIYIVQGDTEAFRYTDRVVTKS